MTAPSPAEVLGTIDGQPASLVEPGSGEVTRLPDQWRSLVEAHDATIRHQTALGLWGDEFLDFVPRFAEALRARLLDVRACLVSGKPVLIYAGQTDGGQLFSWLGRDPRSFRDEPLFWDLFPPPLRAFLQHVHAGFTAGPNAGFGPVGPGGMQTIAEMAEIVDTIETSDDDGEEIATDRLLVIATDGGVTNYCVCPDAPGQIMVLYEGDLVRRDFATELDDLMASAFRDAVPRS
jgi:hypothetical protein